MNALRALVERIVRSQVRYTTRYACSVQLQHDDDSLDLLPDSADMRGRGTSRVPIKHGLPGVRVRVRQGSRVLLGYEDGDPRKPYAALWDPGSVEQILLNGGTAGLARVGDRVTVFWPVLSAIGTLNGAPCALTLTPATPSLGVIDTGSEKVLVGD